MKVYDGATQMARVANGSGAWSFTTATLTEWHAQPDGKGDGCGGQYQRGLVRAG